MGETAARGELEDKYQGDVTESTWLLEGLDCPDCAARIERVVSKVPGVVRATVAFPSGSLKAEYKASEVDPEAIPEGVRRLGYRVKAGPGAAPRSESGHHGGHTHEHGRDDEHEHAHEHAYDHTHSHANERTHHHGHAHEHGGAMWAPLAGALGIAAGFAAERAGVPWFWVPYAAAAGAAGFPVARAGIRALSAGAGADINLLTAIAGIGAIFLGQWGEAASVLTLFSVGEFLEEKASERARKSIADVMDLSPATARIRRGDVTVEVGAGDVSPGDIVIVLPGERLPADGIVLAGESSVNEAPITGESVPVDKRPGSQVFAGSVNGEGPMEFKATRTAEDTTVARIVAMVEDAQSKRAKSQRLVDAFARYWTPGMILLSLAVALFVPLAFGQPFRPWVYRGLTALIVACPCSLVISTPVTVVAAIARAARFGVLIKGGIHLEDLGKVKAVAFDKTGTITKGRIAVERVVTAKSAEVGPDDILAAAAAVESRSEHPLAKAVLSHAREKGLEFDAGEHFATIRGRGAKARVNGRTVYVGSPRLFSDMNVEIPPDLLSAAAEMRDDGQTAVFVGNSTDVLGVIGLADEVREESKDALGRLAGRGLQVVMLTGDEEATARAVAMRTGISSYKAGLLPGGKQEAIAALKAEYGTVAMVGDGVNDAPSLASSDVGIAMGAGADVALETADVALLTNDLCRIPWSIGLGRAARRLIAENVGFSVIIKVAALAFVMAGRLPLWAAVLADSGASVLVTLNGLRILGYK